MTLLMTILFLACEKEEKTTVWVYHPQKRTLIRGSKVPVYIKDDPNLRYFLNEGDCDHYGWNYGQTDPFAATPKEAYECIEIPYETFYKNLK